MQRSFWPSASSGPLPWRAFLRGMAAGCTTADDVDFGVVALRLEVVQRHERINVLVAAPVQ